MKYVTLFLLLLVFNVNAQGPNPPEEDKLAVKQVIVDFFDGFHKQDSIAMSSLVTDNVVLQTTARNKKGETLFKTEKFEKLITSITSIPDSIAFEEKLTSWSIQVDRTMANAWVGYEFWINEKFSHCGINSFQLINFDGEWKIIYLIDTRGKAGCLEE
ncbi:nuclear transport factor 2 family protein [Flagellimonas eckloniae]|uniref:3-methyl-2-oxobutanoate hydroxymethyltransferase n=1 Tax=Flagellimonas eckloniae TaxID=346185 RepID=A0A0Q1CDW7_9FLAO|nr:nuclear transport factor 2 family protein [Allomuricauda eckloniae]KQC28920.1 3-methyl-2-oxobutanoate hydroxymethyltransferase [Allomuricauda eckloniae]